MKIGWAPCVGQTLGHGFCLNMGSCEVELSVSPISIKAHGLGIYLAHGFSIKYKMGASGDRTALWYV